MQKGSDLMMKTDEDFMGLALTEASKGRYHTWTNPMVGAVVVKDNQVLATGYHHRYGDVHAERDAISKLTPEQLFNSTLYVTLEPCNHTGKQPPCSDLIIASKIKRVVISEIDPHSLVTGKGIKKLKAHNISVTTGVLAQEAKKLNQHYVYFYEHNLPYVTLKQALSLDHKCSYPNKRIQITGNAASQRVHQERADYQTIMVGSSTALIDNPTLLTSIKQDHPPIRLVIDRRGRLLNQQLTLFSDNRAPTWIFTQNPELAKTSYPPHVKVFLLDQGTLTEVLQILAQNKVQSVYVEGGPALMKSFVEEKLAQELITYFSPTFLGSNALDGFEITENLKLIQPNYQVLDKDIRISGRIDYV